MCSWRHIAVLLLLPCLSAAANDTLAAGESLTGNRTLVSAGGKFELGFFSPPNSTNYYIGIWYKQIPVQTPIWVMNRYAPVSAPSSAALAVAQDGNLALFGTGNRSREPIWSSNSTNSCADGTVEAVLLDTGNLQVLCGQQGGNSLEIIWQSFEHPTDTLVPGGWVGLNKSTGAYQALRSWRSAADPSTGLYMDRVDPDGSGRYAFMWNGTVIYHYVGPWNGRYFNSIPEMVMSANYNFTYVNNDQEVSYSFQITDPSILYSRQVMSRHGQIIMFDWSEQSGQWLLHWATPTSQCDVYSLCGQFSLCDVANSGYCQCLPGFEPAAPGDWAAQLWSGGCVRKTSLQCSSSNTSSTDGFLPVQNVQLPSNNFSVADSGSAGDCAASCLRNCSCTAYAYYNGGCFVWGGELRNVQQLTDGAPGACTLFLRVAAADLAALNQVVVRGWTLNAQL